MSGSLCTQQAESELSDCGDGLVTLTVELSRGELLVAGLMLVFTCDELVSQVFDVATSSTLYHITSHRI